MHDKGTQSPSHSLSECSSSSHLLSYCYTTQKPRFGINLSPIQNMRFAAWIGCLLLAAAQASAKAPLAQRDSHLAPRSPVVSATCDAGDGLCYGYDAIFGLYWEWCCMALLSFPFPSSFLSTMLMGTGE